MGKEMKNPDKELEEQETQELALDELEEVAGGSTERCRLHPNRRH